MVKESLRKCSHCGHNGHNSRTCSFGKGIKLFGVQININVAPGDHVDQAAEGKQKQDEFMRKSKSMGNLETCNVNDDEYNVADDDDDDDADADADHGYLSDGLIHESSSGPKTARNRRKGKPWSKEEHTSFLFGLEKLGKGDWKGISKNFVHSRTPTQVASHAQKYFLRMMNATERKKRRSSVFDIPLDQRASTSKLAASASTSQNASISPQGSSTVAHVKTCERPPLSPRATNTHHVVPDFNRPRSMFGFQEYAREGLPAFTTSTPEVSFHQMWNFSNQKFTPFSNSAAKYTCSPPSVVAQQSNGAFSLIPSYVAPRAPGPAINEAAIKDGLDLTVQALTF